jgi:hypothetical protein
VKEDDRIQDKAIEKLVADKLRAQLQPPAVGCPDAETLAAYVDGALAARERQAWESHFAACSRCQEQVATLVRWSEEEEPLMRKAAPTRPRAFAPFRWAWAAPALLAVFIAGLWYTGEFRSRLRQTQESSIETPSSVPAPAPPAAPQVPSISGAPPAKGEVAEARKARSESPGVSPLLPRPGPGNAVDLLQAKAARKDSGEEGGPAPAVARLAAPAAGTTSERAVDTNQRALEAFGTGRGGAGAPSKATAAVGRRAEESGATQPLAPSAAGLMKARKTELGKESIATNLAQEASLLSGAEGWRVGPRGLIQKADTHGNWTTVASGVDVDLFDISFPAPHVGWAVGQTGFAIRTTDAGKTWSRISTPTREGLIKVSATSELAARIETRSHQIWETTDGGKSWSSSRPE